MNKNSDFEMIRQCNFDMYFRRQLEGDIDWQMYWEFFGRLNTQFNAQLHKNIYWELKDELNG